MIIKFEILSLNYDKIYKKWFICIDCKNLILYNQIVKKLNVGEKMLFENETFNITKLNNVIYYSPKHLSKFKGKLPTYEIMYYVEGESIISFAGEKYEMSPNHILYLPKGLENDDYSIYIKSPVILYNIYFDTDDSLPDTPIKISVKSGEIKSLFEKLYRTWVSKKDGYYYKSMRYTYNITELLKKQQSVYNNSSKFVRLVPSEEYMSQHYCDYKFDFNKFASLSQLSYSYFKKLFIEKYGVSPVKHINRLKINRACELLETNRFSVSEIAEICGFENTYYFSTVFKNYVGVSPKNYNKSKLKVNKETK